LKLLIDEMYAPAVAAELRARAHDVASVHDLGEVLATGAADADVLAVAQREERTLVTENVRDYRRLEGALLAEGSRHAGLVYTTDRQFPRGDRATVGRLVQALDVLLRDESDLRDRSVVLQRAQR
jgi:predicted nuclease of predicted toxin-antitoxin system